MNPIVKAGIERFWRFLVIVFLAGVVSLGGMFLANPGNYGIPVEFLPVVIAVISAVIGGVEKYLRELKKQEGLERVS